MKELPSNCKLSQLSVPHVLFVQRYTKPVHTKNFHYKIFKQRTEGSVHHNLLHSGVLFQKVCKLLNECCFTLNLTPFKIINLGNFQTLNLTPLNFYWV